MPFLRRAKQLIFKKPCVRPQRQGRAVFSLFLFLLMPLCVFAQDDSPSENELETEFEPQPSLQGEDSPLETELDIEELRQRILGEAPLELMSFSLWDSSVSLFITGSWKGELLGDVGFSVSPSGTGFAAPETPLLFKQEVDLGLSLWIDDRWFVEANFLDNFAQNTYRAGYEGLPGEFFKYAGIGNTGLDFPSFPYLDLGGGSISSFGIYNRFGGDDYNVHILFRYDAASREERVFSGGRERTYSYVQVDNSLRGISFVLPDENIDSEITVYIEDERGTVRDAGGRRWRIAHNSEYAAGRTLGLLELAVKPNGMVAVAYSKGGDSQPWNTSMGNYGTTGFLHTVQQWFGNVNLENYPQSGNGSGPSARPGEVVFGNTHALVIREPGTFSPFERQNRYEAPSGSSESAALVRLSSGETINGFDLVQLDTNAAQANVYELLGTGASDMRGPSSLWPLAAKYPEIYLPSAVVFTGDITIRFTNYNNQSGYYIGTDVVPGSIQVWRSGIQVSNFNYNSSSGEVSINGPVGFNENIRITFLKLSDETRLGSIAAGIGADYGGEGNPFSAQAAVGVRMNLSGDDSFTEKDLDSGGNVGLGAKVLWDYDFFKANVTAGFAFVLADTTGLYRAAGMEGNETVLALPPASSFISHPTSLYTSNPVLPLTLDKRADLIYRNYSNNDAFNANYLFIESNAPVVSGREGPYPARDPQLGNAQVLVAEFTLDDAQIWTGFQVPLNDDILSRAGEIEIPFRFYGFSGNTAKFKLIIQIGALAGKDFVFTENPALVWEKEIFPTGGAFDTDAHIARFPLSDEDRLKLGDAKYLRVIVVFDDTGPLGESVTGRVLIAPPIVRGASFRAVTFDGVTVKASSGFPLSENYVTALETLDHSLFDAYSEIMKRLHPSGQNTQRVLEIKWDDMQTGISAGIDGRIGEMPLSDYRELSFFVKGPQPTIPGSLSFIAASGPDSLSDSRLEAQIPLNAFTAGQWSMVTIRYQGDNTGVFVNGARVAGASYRYRPDRQINNSESRTSYVAIFVNPADPTQNLGDGTISIDEIILEDPLTSFRINAGAGVEYSRPGTIFSIGDIPVLADFSITSALESEFRTEGEGSGTRMPGSAVNRTGVNFSFFGVDVSGNFSFTAAENTFLWSADHKISKSIGSFYIEESFYASPEANTVRHNLNLSFSSDFYARFAADALYEFSFLRQRWNLGAGYISKKDLIPSVALSFEALWTGKNIIAPVGYAQLWAESWLPLVPGLGEGADSRKTQTQIVITQRSKPIGVVVTIEGSSNFSGANSLTVLEYSTTLDVPLVFNSFSLNFRAGRNFKRRLYFAGINALDDGEKFFESVYDSFQLWKVFPGYSLFAPELADAFSRGLDDSHSANLSQYAAFTDLFGVNVVLPNVYNFASFFVPSRAALRIERVLEQKLDTRTDTLKISGSLGFQAINMFGALGYHPLFKFYQTDEFSHTIETSVIIPANENVTWRVQSVFSASFRGFSGGALNLSNTLVFNSGGWLESFSAAWSVPTEKSLLSIIYDWIAAGAAKQSSWPALSSFLNQDYEQMRTVGLDLSFDKTTDYLRWTVSASHEETIRILGSLNFSAFIKIRCSQDFKSEVFIFDVLLGTALRVSF